LHGLELILLPLPPEELGLQVYTITSGFIDHCYNYSFEFYFTITGVQYCGTVDFWRSNVAVFYISCVSTLRFILSETKLLEVLITCVLTFEVFSIFMEGLDCRVKA
jgi:hypothetical protein